MTAIAVETVRDVYGNGHSVVTERCDGPGCSKTIKSNEPNFATWGSVLGFVNIDDDPGFDDRPSDANWCSVRCLRAWVAQLYVCDHCGGRVRVADALHSGGYRHDNTEANAAAEWCETDSGYVRVSVDGFTGIQNLPRV